MAKQLHRTGRPTNAPPPGKRVSLGLKVTAEIKQRLDKAARETGRTQSQEAEVRLEQSFRSEDLLPQILDLVYGRETAGLLMTIGECIKDAAPIFCFLNGGGLSAADWMQRRWTYNQLREAIQVILEVLEPPGTDVLQTPAELVGEIPTEMRLIRGQHWARGTLRGLLGPDDSEGSLEMRMAPARERLAHAVARLRGDNDAG
jgi:hypothetical protein